MSEVHSSALAYALGIRDPATGRLEFLRRDVFAGNLMRTPDLWFAWTWRDVNSVQLFLNAIPENCKGQLADRELIVVPFRATCGDPVAILSLKTETPLIPLRPQEVQPAAPPKRQIKKTMTLFDEPD